jgi:hypothetical protein
MTTEQVEKILKILFIATVGSSEAMEHESVVATVEVDDDAVCVDTPHAIPAGTIAILHSNDPGDVQSWSEWQCADCALDYIITYLKPSV